MSNNMKAVRLGVELCGVKLPCCIMNASGPCCSTIEELRALGNSESGAIVTKSCTLLQRDGNEEPRYCDLPNGGAVQSMGLPNLGYQEYAKFVPLLRSEFPTKPVIVSVSGLCADDNRKILTTIDGVDPSLIELNLSCPNIVGKPQVAYDFEETEKLLSLYCECVETPLGLKLPAYLDPCHHDIMAEIIKAHSRVKFISCINSVGNVLPIDPEGEKAMIRPRNGFGGLSGTYVKPIGLANVNAFRRRLGDSVSVIGVGGVMNGTDVFEYLLAGASAVQVGTCLWREGTSCFGRIKRELEEILSRKGYTSPTEVCGKLQQ